MRLKLAIAAMLSVGLVIVLWAFIGGGPGNNGDLAGGPDDALQPGASPAVLPELEPAPTVALGDKRERAPERRPAAAPTTSVSTPRPWEGQLAGIFGRVVDFDGAPQPRLRVDLLQGDWTLLVAEDLRDLGSEVSLSLAFAVTDAEGRFRIDGAWGPSFHGLGIDLGGPRSTLRVIEHALPHGEFTDLGDIVLAPFGVLVGQVVDEEGQPVGGARVRVGALPPELLAVRVYDLRADSLVGMCDLLKTGQPAGLIAVPPWLKKHMHALPVPTTTTSADGSFRLEGVPLARVLGGVDLPGYLGLPVGPLEMTEGEEDLGRLTLTRGRTLRGTVLDAAGKPAPGFEVHAGAELPVGPVALLAPCGKSDAEGRFAVTGVPPEGRAVAIARRAEGEAYAAAIAESGGELVIRVPSRRSLDVRLVDAEGTALSSARLQLTSLGTEDEGQNYMNSVMFMLHTPNRSEGFREVETGLYRRSQVSFGTYELKAEVAGLAPALSQIEVGETTGIITLTCGVGRTLALTVLDGVSGEPVRGARAAILQAERPLVSTLALGWSDAEGKVRLGPFELGSGGSNSSGPMGRQPPILVVEHPGYPAHEAPLEELGPAPVVRLRAGGALKGLIHWGGAVPERLYTILIQYRDADGLAEIFLIPRFGLSNLAGEFRFDNLCAGKYRVEIMEQFLGKDLVGLATAQEEPVQVYRETVEVTPGNTTEFQIDLSPSGMGPVGRIVGTVQIDGTPLEGAQVEIGGSRDMVLSTDAWGRFDSGEIPVRRSSRVTITGDLSYHEGGQAEQRIHSERVQLKAGEVHEIDLDLSPRILAVEVVDASTAAPLDGVVVMARTKSGRADPARGKTDGRGSLRLLVLQEGSLSLEAHRDGYLVKHVEVDPNSVASQEVFRIELAGSVPCAGRTVLSSHEPDPGAWIYLRVSQAGGGPDDGEYLRDGKREFSFDGFGPGTYEARVYAPEYQSETITFVLGVHGDQNLILRF